MKLVFLIMTLLALCSVAPAGDLDCSERRIRILNEVLNFDYPIDFIAENGGWLDNINFECANIKSAGITLKKVQDYKKLLLNVQAVKVLSKFGKNEKGITKAEFVQRDLQLLRSTGADVSTQIIQNYLLKLKHTIIDHERIYNSKQTCPTLPAFPIRNVEVPKASSGPGWCAAAGAAAIVSNDLGLLVSPISLALAYTQSLVDAGYISESEVTVDQGFPIDGVIGAAVKSNLACRFEDLPDKDVVFGGKQYTTLELLRLLKTGDLDLSKDNINRVFPKFRTESYLKLVKPAKVPELLETICDPLSSPVRPVLYNETTGDPEKIMALVTNALERSKPVAIDFHFSMYFYDDSFNLDPSLVRHVAEVVGQRFDDQLNQCEYVIHDSLLSDDDLSAHRRSGNNVVVSREALARLTERAHSY